MLDQLLSLFTGIPDELSAGSFANHHIILPDTNTDLSKFDSENDIKFKGSYEIRKQLYKLSSLSKNLQIIDLGNINLGNSYFDTVSRLRSALEILIQLKTKIVLLGGTSIFNKENISAFNEKERPLNYISVDSQITWEHLEVHPFFNHPEVDDEHKFVNFINIGLVTRIPSG